MNVKDHKYWYLYPTVNRLLYKSWNRWCRLYYIVFILDLGPVRSIGVSRTAMFSIGPSWSTEMMTDRMAIIHCYLLPSNKNDPISINLSFWAACPLVFSTINPHILTSGRHISPEMGWLIHLDIAFRHMFCFKVSMLERYENINSRTMKKCLFVL